jgi:hypothetical protein
MGWRDTDIDAHVVAWLVSRAPARGAANITGTDDPDGHTGERCDDTDVTCPVSRRGEDASLEREPSAKRKS